MSFKLHFVTKYSDDDFRVLDFDCEEDWKAAVYAWGGPKPSLIAHTKVEFDRPSMSFKVMFLEKRFDPELTHATKENQEDEKKGSEPGPAEAEGHSTQGSD